MYNMGLSILWLNDYHPISSKTIQKGLLFNNKYIFRLISDYPPQKNVFQAFLLVTKQIHSKHLYIGLFIYSPQSHKYVYHRAEYIEISWWILWILLVLCHFQTLVTKSWFTTLFSMHDSWYLILSLLMEIKIGSELCTFIIFWKILEKCQFLK